MQCQHGGVVVPCDSVEVRPQHLDATMKMMMMMISMLRMADMDDDYEVDMESVISHSV
jgi:hypothetical protein